MASAAWRRRRQIDFHLIRLHRRIFALSKLRKPRPIICRWNGPLRSAVQRRQLIEASAVASEILALPRQHLQAYEDVRDDSPLGQSFTFAAQMFANVDMVCVVGLRQVLEPIRMLAESCLDPFHNETSRAERGSKPRFYLLDDRLDNDRLASILQRSSSLDSLGSLPERSWGLIILGNADELPAAKVLRRAFDQQPARPEGCFLEIPIVEPSPLGNATLYVAAALGLDTIQILVGSMAVSDAVLEGVGGTIQERLVECFADRPRIEVVDSAIDRWVDWYRNLGPHSGSALTISAMRPRMNHVIKTTDQHATIELPVIDTLSIGTLTQAAALGHAVWSG